MQNQLEQLSPSQNALMIAHFLQVWSLEVFLKSVLLKSNSSPIESKKKDILMTKTRNRRSGGLKKHAKTNPSANEDFTKSMDSY